MKAVEIIKSPIYKEIELFEDTFKDAIKTGVPLLNRITHFIIKRKGKQMRPMFVFLVSKMVSNGRVDKRTYRGASVIELIHTATLVHDDVVDNSYKRRGFFSINALWKNKIAVLLGDFLLSKGLLLSIDNQDFDILKYISLAVRDMSEGEILQIEKARRLDITEEIYFEVIRKKTATLISTCCIIGAVSVNASDKEVERMRLFGEYIGIAFQIKDDLFDYGEDKIGKPTGIDIREKKMTLPLIYALNNCAENDKKWLINSVKKNNTNRRVVKEVILFVKKVGGIDYTREVMNKYKDKALKILKNYPESKYRNSLETMVNYVIEREK